MDNYNTQWHVAAIYGWGEDMVGMRIKLSGYIHPQMNIDFSIRIFFWFEANRLNILLIIKSN